MVQKYIAFFEEEAVEAYNDIRRLKAMGDNVIELSHQCLIDSRYVLHMAQVMSLLTY